MSIKLTTAGGSPSTFQDSQKDLKSEYSYITATVNKGSWIMYKEKNYNNDIPGGAKADILFLNEGDAAVDIKDHNASMYLLPPSHQDALVLFKKVNFGGVSPDPKMYVDSVPDITKDFPPGPDKGASSAIVTGSTEWKVFTEKKYDPTGLSQRLGSGTQCSVLNPGVENEVQSVQMHAEG